jgi:hypothetical protein
VEVQKHLRKFIGGMTYIFRTQYSLAMHKVKEYLEWDGTGEAKRVGSKSLEPFTRSMTTDELYGLFAEARGDPHEKPNETECNLWLQMLRNLGVVHWVGDVGSLRKGTLIASTIYNVNWVQSLVYGVICADAPNRGTGVAAEERLCQLMCGRCPENTPTQSSHACQASKGVRPCHREVLELMEACGLIYPAKDRGNARWLVPDWLPSGRGFILPGTPTTVLELTPLLPESLLLRYAGNHFTYIADDDGFPCLSRDHVVVREAVRGMAQAAIRADWKTQQITVWGFGGSQRDRFSIVEQAKNELSNLALEEGLDLKLLSEKQVRELDIAQRTQASELTNEAKDQRLTGLVMVITADSNVIYRDRPKYDYGIDGELEFRKEDGTPSGRMIFLQLKSGDSYRRESKRTGEQVFYVKNPNHLEYWRDPQADVHLVIGDSNWRVRWMNITQYLNDPTNQDNRSIVFAGEKFDALSIERVRQESLKRNLR